MNKHILFVRKIAAMLNTFLIMNLIMLWFLIAMLQIEVKPAYFAFLVWLAVANFTVKEISENSIIPLGYSIIMSAAVYFSIHIWGVRIMFWVFIVWMLMEDVREKLKGFTKQADIEVRWGGFVITFAGFLFGLNIGSSMLKTASFVTLLFMLLIFFVEKYFDGLYLYLEQSRSFKGVPLRNVIETNSIMVAVVIAVLFVGILLGTVLPLDRLISMVLGVIWKGLNYFFGFIYFVAKWFATLFSGGDVKSIEAPITVTEEPEPIPKLAGDIAEKVLQLIVALALAWVLAKLVVSIAKKFIVRNRNLPRHVEISVIKSVSKERIKKTRKTKTDKTLLGRARRLYKTRVLENVDSDNLLKSDTCKTIADKSQNDISDITEIYEDIRYGDMTVDEDILRKMNAKIDIGKPMW